MASKCSWLDVVTRNSPKGSAKLSNCARPRLLSTNPSKGYALVHHASWSDLPIDVLLIICGKLIDVGDYVRFGAICISWRTVLWLIRKSIPSQPPVFMFPNILSRWPNSTGIFRHDFFSIKGSNRGISNMTQYIEKWFGTSHGWLLLECRCDNTFGFSNMRSIRLLNPFSSASNVIDFPALPEDHSVTKGVISHNPTQTSNFVVMVIYYSGADCGLAFIKSGDKSWNHLYPYEVKHTLQNIIFCEDQFYVMNDSCEVLSCDIMSATPTVTKVAPSPIQSVPGYKKFYLVESSGDLLWVKRELVRTQVDGDWFCSTVGFCIFKFQTTGRKWTKLKTLGGQALFLSDFSCISLLATDFSQCEPNHIYFLGDWLSDAGVYNLEGASFQLQTSEKISGRGQYPVWVQPTLEMSNPRKIPESSVQCKHAYHTDERYDVLSHLRTFDSLFNIYYRRDEVIADFYKNPSLAEKAILRDRIRYKVPVYENFMFLWNSNRISKAADYPLWLSSDERMTNLGEKTLVDTPMALSGPKVVAEPNITQLKEDLENSQQHRVLTSQDVQKEERNTLDLEGKNLAEKVSAKAAIRDKKIAKKKLRQLKRRLTRATEAGSVSSTANREEQINAVSSTSSIFGFRKGAKILFTLAQFILQCKKSSSNWLVVALLMLLVVHSLFLLGRDRIEHVLVD